MAARLPACQSGTRHPDTWHSTNPDEQTEARGVCLACPDRPLCQTVVLATETGWPAEDRHGIYAALNGQERAGLDPTAPTRPRPRTAPADCGTHSAYRRHRRNNEPIDDACHAAALREWAERRATRSQKAAA